MAIPQYDDAALVYDSSTDKYDGGCVSTITYDEPGLSWDDPEVTYEGCDHRGGVIPPPVVVVTQQVGGANLGRRGPYYPDRTPEQVLREEEEIMVMF